MSFIIPQITYPAASPTTTLSFSYPPTEKIPVPDQEGVSAVSKTLSGLKQTMWQREDEFVRLKFTSVPFSDLAAWKSFMNYAHQGGSFLYYPDATGTAYDECWLEDSGGSARSSTGSSSDAWSPNFAFRGFAEFELVIFKVPGGLTHP